MNQKIKISDYNYLLPEERIAKYPLQRRDASKLLVFKDGEISDDIFRNLSRYIPEGSLMVFNNTKVVPARLFFRKESGAVIQILCLNPTETALGEPSDFVVAFASVGECLWKVVVGNSKRWKEGEVRFASDENTASLNLRAELVTKLEGIEAVVKFKWDGPFTFSEVLERCGEVPIPPYLNRATEELDKSRYQTMYAKVEGSVAAPTAGLHFTPEVFTTLDERRIKQLNICLHVGAGTFVPVKSEYIDGHKMHREPFSVSVDFLQSLLELKEGQKVVSVGTTSTRCLESLYYIGVHCLEGFADGEPERTPAPVAQWEPYEESRLKKRCTFKESISAILSYLKLTKRQRLVSATSIIIVPGYEFKVVDIQITNFHQPQSTLLLLIAAIIGDGWKKVYEHALENDYRFLSYGDSSILFR